MDILYRRGRAAAAEVMTELPGDPSDSTVRLLEEAICSASPLGAPGRHRLGCCDACVGGVRSTTLCAMIDYINRTRDEHSITIEDPIMPAASQQEFSERCDTDFAHEIPNLARFRCNVFADRKGWGAVFRVIPTVTKKLVAPDEAYSKSTDKAGFEALLKRAGVDTRTLTTAQS